MLISPPRSTFKEEVTLSTSINLDIIFLMKRLAEHVLNHLSGPKDADVPTAVLGNRIVIKVSGQACTNAAGANISLR